jgi:hypothetical protein
MKTAPFTVEELVTRNRHADVAATRNPKGMVKS